MIGHDHQHDAWRHEDPERASRTDGAGSQGPGIALAEHDRQADQAQQHHRGPDDAGTGCEQDSNQHHADRQPTTDPAKEPLHRLHHPLSHAAAVKQQPHEDEHRQGDQFRLGEQATVDAVDKACRSAEVELGAGVGGAQGVADVVGSIANADKDNGDPAEHEGDRKP